MKRQGGKVNDVVLVTGVGPGTGKAIVERFAASGYAVAMLARSAQRLNDIARATPYYPFVCDVTDADRPACIEEPPAVRRAQIVIRAVGAERGTYLDVDAKGARRL